MLLAHVIEVLVSNLGWDAYFNTRKYSQHSFLLEAESTPQP